jgi:hypothetical protein
MPSGADPRLVASAEALDASLIDTASRLTRQDTRAVERDLKRELRASLSGRLEGLAPTERPLNLKGWPKVGGVDMAIDIPNDLPVLIELKWGAETLYNCAWDAIKLALALDEGESAAAYMVAGAPMSEWSSGARACR